MTKDSEIEVEVVFVGTQGDKICPVKLPLGATIKQAIEHSGILHFFPTINLDQHRVGIFGKMKTLETMLQQGDQVEIYRPLTQSALDARKARVKIQRAKQRQKVKHPA
jgi:putative ubiquitin-RnfH superfamily antitoxin RatB of RatAB toxin-antitoxin module